MARQKTRLTLIHNDKAGDARHCRAELVALLKRAGYRVTYIAYKRCDLAKALDRPAELVAVAGGDGTIAKVAAQARPDGPPLAVLPLGTANNIAKSLGLDRPLGELMASWSERRLRPFYLIEATGPWGRRRIAEGLGFGALEHGIAAMPKDPDFAKARQVLADAAIDATAEHLELRLDGERIAQPLAVLEVSTVPLVGPNLRLAAAADPTRPEFAICIIADAPDQRRALANWLVRPEDAPAPVAVRTAARATITGRFRRVRLNGHVWQAEPGGEADSVGPITLASEAEPLRFLAPG
jgi:diacylglycerol kinase (ATP)